MQFVPYRALRNEPRALRKKLQVQGDFVVTVGRKPLVLMINLAEDENLQDILLMVSRLRVQSLGGSIEEIRPGDVIWAPPSEKHWRGAAPTTAVTHLAIQEQLEGKTADWMEKVSDEQYDG